MALRAPSIYVHFLHTYHSMDMNGNKLRAATAALLAACLVLLSPGLGAYAAAGGVVARSSAGRGVRTGIAAVPVLVGNSVRTVSLGRLVPAALTGLRVYQSPAATPAGPSAAGLSGPSASRVLAALDAVPAPAALYEQRSSLEAAQAGLQEVAASLSGTVSAENLQSASAALFSGRNRLGCVRDVPRAVPAAGRPAAAARVFGLSRTAVVAGAVTASAALSAGPAISASPAAASFWHSILGGLGWAGNIVGNGLGLVFAVPQIYKTFKDGNDSGTPVWRAVAGAVASLALGLVNAPLDGQSFWGVQNFFGALTLIAPLGIGRILARRGDRPRSPRATMFWTIASAGIALLASAGLYAGAAAVMPGLLAAVLSRSGIAALTLGIQVASGCMFLLLFLPDIAALLKKQRPSGFTSLFNMLFFVGSLAFMGWTLQVALFAPAGSEQRLRYMIYFGQNVVYALVSGASYMINRKHKRGA